MKGLIKGQLVIWAYKENKYMYTKTPTDSQARHDASPLAELWVFFS